MHPADIHIFQPPPGHEDFFDKHLVRFDLDCLADNAIQHLGGTRFDLITSHYCVCHLKDPLGALCLAFELLEAGGLLLFIEPRNAQTGALPYTDHNNYEFCAEGATAAGAGEAAAGAPVKLRQLLSHWSAQGVGVFSSCQPRPPHRHVLALQRPSHSLRLSLPPGLRGGRASRPPSGSSPEADADVAPFRSPEGKGASFEDWLASACQLGRVP